METIQKKTPFLGGYMVPDEVFGVRQGENKGFQVCKKKMITSAEILCKFMPDPFKRYSESVMNLKFEEEPKYAAYIQLFEPLLTGRPKAPICIESALKVQWLTITRQVDRLLLAVKNVD